MFTMLKFHPEDDTTASSSWNDLDDLSLCTDKDTDDTEQLSGQPLGNQPSLTETLHRTVLRERAAMLIKRESSIQYSTSNYVEDAADDLSRLWLTSDASCTSHQTTGGGEIDLACRAKMMDWSVSVVEFSYPPPSEPCKKSNRKRKHSVETLRIISAAFSYVDRVMAQSTKIQTRKDYKLLCMICVHLAAKMSGLFSRGDQEYIQDSILDPKSKTAGSRTEGGGANKSIAISKSSSVSSIYAETTVCSSSISSTHSRVPSVDEDLTEAGIWQTPPTYTCQPRPSLHLLSFKGLHSLCQGEFSIEDMCQMELVILSTLDWRLNGGLMLEWLSLMLECMIYCHSYGLHEDETLDFQSLKESAISQLEVSIMSSKPITAKPSILAHSAIIKSLKEVCITAKNHDLSALGLCFMQVLGIPEWARWQSK